MKQIKLLVLGIAVTAMVTLSGCAGQSAAAESPANRLPGEANAIAASNRVAPPADKGGPEKGNKDDKGAKSKDDKGDGKDDGGNKNGKAKSNNGRGNSASGPAFNPGNGQPPARQGPVGRGPGAWWRDFRSRVFGEPEDKQGGWQLGRFKGAFPFAYPPGWAVRERGDAAVVGGEWQGEDYVFQMTRTTQVQAESLEDWVTADLDRLDVPHSNVRYAESDRVRIAVVTGIQDPSYECPVALVYLWTANPAGNYQRQARGVISQAPGAACNPAGLAGFVDAYLNRIGAEDDRALRDAATPASSATAAPTAPATATRVPGVVTPAAGAWQRTRFFNAFSFAYPQGWSMDRLGDTAHLQGEYQGRDYVVDMVWVRDAPQTGLEQWARDDLADLGVNAQGLRIDYAAQDDGAQIAVVSGISLPGYACPVIRMYVLADNTATAGERAYTVTVAQANGQSCDLEALENLAYAMVEQV